MYDRMRSGQLIVVDDLAKMLLIDPKLGFTTRKILINYMNEKVAEEIKLIHDELLSNFDVDEITKNLLRFIAKHNLCSHFNVHNNKWLSTHLKIYLKVLHPKSGLVIQKCSKYTSDNYKGMSMFANTDLKEGKILNIVGIFKPLTNEEEEDLRCKKLDFSIMYTSRLKKPVLMLGPAAFINHDCRPNCAYKSHEKSVIVMVVLRDIKKGEELFCYYDDNYFGHDNQNCECLTCEKKNQAAFVNLSGKWRFIFYCPPYLM